MLRDFSLWPGFWRDCRRAERNKADQMFVLGEIEYISQGAGCHALAAQDRSREAVGMGGEKEAVKGSAHRDELFGLGNVGMLRIEHGDSSQEARTIKGFFARHRENVRRCVPVRLPGRGFEGGLKPLPAMFLDLEKSPRPQHAVIGSSQGCSDESFDQMTIWKWRAENLGFEGSSAVHETKKLGRAALRQRNGGCGHYAHPRIRPGRNRKIQFAVA